MLYNKKLHNFDTFFEIWNCDEKYYLYGASKDAVQFIETFDNLIPDNKILIESIIDDFIDGEKTYDSIYDINSSDVFYDRNLMKISSRELTEVNDNDDNKFLFSKGLIFDVNKEIISSKKAIVTDKNYNNYIFENSKVDLKTNEIIGKEIKIDFEDSFLIR